MNGADIARPGDCGAERAMTLLELVALIKISVSHARRTGIALDRVNVTLPADEWASLAAKLKTAAEAHEPAESQQPGDCAGTAGRRDP